MINQDVGHFFSKSVYGLRYTKSFSKGTLEIYTNYGTFEDSDIEVFPIEEASYVECELNNSFRRGYKNVNLDTIDLTFEELSLIESWLATYFTGEGNYPDIVLPAYDPNDNNLLQGNLLLSEIKKNNYYFTTTPCDYSLARYNELDDTWTAIKAIIRDDGSYTVDPDGYCERCVLFLTEEEWIAFPPPDVEDPEIPAIYIRYNFSKEKWEDIRTPEELREEYLLFVNSRFSYAISSAADFYFGTDNQYAVSLSQSANIKIDYTSDHYKAGTQAIADLFGVSSSIEHQEDFSKEFYEEAFKQAREYIEGQRDLWLNLPNRLQSEFYDLNTQIGWFRLIDKFRDWFESVYSEYTE